MRSMWVARHVGLSIVLCCGTLQAQQDAASVGPEISKSERLTFEQEKAVANMRELEDRMIKLAELLRDSEPDESARLLLGVEKARDQLILEQMRQVTKLLDDIELATASRQQIEILKKLHVLKEVLLNADLDLRLKLDQIEKILDAQERLEQLSTKEQEQKAATERTQRAGKGSKSLQPSELRNQKSAEDLQQQIEKINGASDASKSVVGAAGSMGKAGECLDNDDCSSACQAQQAAIEQLQKADKDLENLKQQLKQQAENPARTRVMELLKEMVERQSKVKEATESVLSATADEAADVEGTLRRLAVAETKVMAAADECIETCEFTQFSLVLPEAMHDIRERMQSVHGRLDAAKVDGSLVADEQAVIDDLNELLEAMQQGGKPGSPTNEKSNGNGPAGNRNKLIAEVRMLYWMQKAVKRKTKMIHERKVGGTLVGEELRQHTFEMHRQQDKIRGITGKLRELTNPGYVNGDAI